MKHWASLVLKHKHSNLFGGCTYFSVMLLEHISFCKSVFERCVLCMCIGALYMHFSDMACWCRLTPTLFPRSLLCTSCGKKTVICVFHVAVFPSILESFHSNTLTNSIHSSGQCVDMFGAGKNCFLTVSRRTVLLWQIWQSDWTAEWFADYLPIIWLGDWFVDSWMTG